MAEREEFVPTGAPEDSPREVLRAGEGLREARERLIAELIESVPEFDDAFALGSLRGEHTTMLVGVSPEHREAARLIGQIYQLLHLEMREHPERFGRPELG